MSTSELNVKLYNRRELSGQRSCHPSEVLGGNRESRSSISVMDRVLNDCWTDEEVKAATGTANSHLVMHPLQLNSSYATVKGSINTRDSNGTRKAFYLLEFWILFQLIFSRGLVAFHARKSEAIIWPWFLNLPSLKVP